MSPKKIALVAGREFMADVAGSPGEAVVRNQQNATRVSGATPEFHLVDRPASADLAAEKRWLTAPPAGDLRPLALVVVRPDALQIAPGQTKYGSYDLFVP